MATTDAGRTTDECGLAYTNPKRRHDFVFFVEVTDGNPNGDPDAGNMPRTDPETGHGLVTDVFWKRRHRDMVAAAWGDEERFKIYIESGAETLNEKHQRAYTALKLTATGTKQGAATRDQATAWMCENFYDIRMFGAVMSTGVNCGQVRGPVQLTFARSMDPVLIIDTAITRCAVTEHRKDAAAAKGKGKGAAKGAAKGEDKAEDKAEGTPDAGSEAGEETARGAETGTMARKPVVAYGLYRGQGFFTPAYAEKTKVDRLDLERFWEAFMGMTDLDRSAARGMMSLRGLHIFSHESKLGNAPAHELFERVEATLRPGVDQPRRFKDYLVTVDDKDMPPGVVLTSLVG